MKKIIGQMLLGVVCILFLLSLSFAIEKKQKEATETDKVPRTITNTSDIPPATGKLQYDHYDLAAQMKLTRLDNGIVTFYYKACNVGNRSFVLTATAIPSSVNLYRVSREGYTAIERHHFSDLRHNTCTEEFTTTYTIPLFIEWGTRTPRAGECQSEGEFEVSIVSDVSDDPHYNDRVTKKVPYLYQCVQ